MKRALAAGRAAEQTHTQGLVASAQRGDSEAFGQLYEQLAPRVYRYFYHHLDRHAHLAEGLTEEVFVKVIEKLNQYQDRGLPFSAWVFRIAHNHFIDHLRSLPKSDATSIDRGIDVPEQRAEQRLKLVLTRSELRDAMSPLTELQRQVLGLRFGQGMTLFETSQIVGKSEDAVKELQARGLAAMTKVLKTSGTVVAAQSTSVGHRTHRRRTV